jgi:hypothetical protein
MNEHWNTALLSAGVDDPVTQGQSRVEGECVVSNLEELRTALLQPGAPHHIKIQIPGIPPDPELEFLIHRWKSECGCSWGATVGTILAILIGITHLMSYWMPGLISEPPGWLWTTLPVVMGGVLGKIAGLAYAQFQLKQIFVEIVQRRSRTESEMN